MLYCYCSVNWEVWLQSYSFSHQYASAWPQWHLPETPLWEPLVLKKKKKKNVATKCLVHMPLALASHFLFTWQEFCPVDVTKPPERFDNGEAINSSGQNWNCRLVTYMHKQVKFMNEFVTWREGYYYRSQPIMSTLKEYYPGRLRQSSSKCYRATSIELNSGAGAIAPHPL